MKSLRLVLAALAVLWTVRIPGLAEGHRARQFEKLNLQLHGQVLDFTDNHGADRRIWSPALCERRDLYVYVPPGYDCSHRYPVILWLHGFAADETSFVKSVVQLFDNAIVCGQIPPVI